MKNFRTFNLAVEFYKASRRLPFTGESKQQLKRAAHSIVLNLAKGRGKRTTKDQRRFFHMALGSLRECQAILILEEMEGQSAWNLLDKLGANLYCLIRSLS
jgi:four helix bundle protein